MLRPVAVAVTNCWKAETYDGLDIGGWPFSRALRGLDDHHIVVMAALPLQALTPQADLVAYELIAELERVEAIARDRAVAQSDHRAAQDRFEFILQAVERLDRLDVDHPFADIEDRGCEFAGLLRRHPRDLGVERDEQRTDDAQCSRAEIKQVAVAL